VELGPAAGRHPAHAGERAVAPETGLSSADFLVLNRLKAAPEYRMEGLKALAAKLDWSPSRLSTTSSA